MDGHSDGQGEEEEIGGESDDAPVEARDRGGRNVETRRGTRGNDKTQQEEAQQGQELAGAAPGEAKKGKEGSQRFFNFYFLCICAHLICVEVGCCGQHQEAVQPGYRPESEPFRRGAEEVDPEEGAAAGRPVLEGPGEIFVTKFIKKKTY